MLLFFLFILSNVLISYGIGLCDLNHWEGNLTCVVNEDDTYNITFDCNLNVKKVSLHTYIYLIRFKTDLSLTCDFF